MIRHGESEANIGLSTSDPKTIILTENGRKQAQIVADNWNEEVHSIYYSLYDRTLQTAKPLIAKYPSARVEVDKNIHEFTYLDGERCRDTTAEQRQSMKEQFWLQENIYYKETETTESVYDLVERVSDFISHMNHIHEQYPEQNIVIFTHGQFMRVLIEVLKHKQHDISKIKKSDIQKVLQDKNTEIKNCECIEITTYFIS